MDLFAAADAREARDQAMKKVIARNPTWSEEVREFIRNLPSGWCGTGEDIRKRFGRDPTHPNAWGAVIKGAVSRGVLVKTGRYLQMVDVKSHARATPEYQRT